MRDRTLINNFEALNKQVVTTYRQMVFLDTRMQAFEMVLSRRWSFLHAIIRPKWIVEEVNILHLALMRKHDEDLRKAREEQETKPNLTRVKPIEVFR